MSGLTVSLSLSAEQLVSLPAEVADALYALVALADAAGSTARADHELIDAAEVARRFRVARAWVYENADLLGAVRLGNGPKPRLRFDPERVAEALTASSTGTRSGAEKAPAPGPIPARRRRRISGTDVPLLPVRGRSTASGGKA